MSTRRFAGFRPRRSLRKLLYNDWKRHKWKYILVIPVILLVVGQSTGLLLVSAWILLAFGLVCTLLAWLLLKTCMGKFTYETLLQ